MDSTRDLGLCQHHRLLLKLLFEEWYRRVVWERQLIINVYFRQLSTVSLFDSLYPCHDKTIMLF